MLIVEYRGYIYIYNLLSRYYFQSSIHSFISRFIKGYIIYKQLKSYYKGKYGLLKLLLILDHYQQNISVDFITYLLKYKYQGRIYKYTIVIINRLSKKRKYIILDSLLVELVTQVFLEYIQRKEGYPRRIILDYRLQFTLHFQ